MTVKINGTEGITNATWTNATKPPSPDVGQQGYNTDLGLLETWTGGAWAQSISAPGGNITASYFIGNGSLLTNINGANIVGNVGNGSGNVTSNTVTSNTITSNTMIVNDTITAGNVSTGGTINATGNVTGGNIISNGTVSSNTITSNTMIVNDTITAGNVSTGGTINATGNVTGGNIISNGTVSSNTFTGNTITINNTANVGNLVTGGTINATGNVTGGNIISNGTISGGNLSIGNTITVLPNAIVSFGGNVDSYLQVNLQNLSGGSNAEADFVITANNGSDTVNYVNMGIVNSGYDANTPTNSLGNIIYAADAYVYAQGNVSNTTQSGGNLALGTTVASKSVNIFAGGNTSSNIVGTFSNTGLVVTGSVSTTSIIEGQSTLTYAATTNINLSNGDFFQVTCVSGTSATVSFTTSNVATSGKTSSFILNIINGGSVTVTWMTGTKWPGGTAPTLTSSGTDAIAFYTYDGGTTWYGQKIGLAYA